MVIRLKIVFNASEVSRDRKDGTQDLCWLEAGRREGLGGGMGGRRMGWVVTEQEPKGGEKETEVKARCVLSTQVGWGMKWGSVRPHQWLGNRQRQ